MLKIKLAAVVAFLLLTAAILGGSRQFAVVAGGDVLEEIAAYKTWRRVNQEAIKVPKGFQIDGVAGQENVFIVNGQEVTNLRGGALDG